MKMTNLLIKLSLSDLESSRILYDKRQYRTSYFFFQQAAEKANKAFGLFAEIITEEDLFRIQHNQTKIYRKGLSKQVETTEQFLGAMKVFPHLENHEFIKQIDTNEYEKYLKGGLSYIDSLHNLDLVNIPANELNSFLRELRKLERAKQKLKKERIDVSAKDRESFKRHMLLLADMIGSFGTEQAKEEKAKFEAFLGDKKQSEKLVNILVRKGLPLKLDEIFIATTLWLCAIVTVRHSSLTRYPDDAGNNPLDIYKKKLPIVSKQPQFMDFLEKALGRLPYLIELKRKAESHR